MVSVQSSAAADATVQSSPAGDTTAQSLPAGDAAVVQATGMAGFAKTPIGAFHAVFTGRGLARLDFPSDQLSSRREGERAGGGESELTQLSEQLTAYFRGTLRDFSIPLDLRGTPFQLAVWNALLGVEYGQVRSYADIARAIGRPHAVRAVGAANGANPVPIIVPCHRIIGSNRTLTGYGGGLHLKEYLLRLEGVTDAQAIPMPQTQRPLW